MLAAVLTAPRPIGERPLKIEEAPQPELKPGYVLLRVKACGVCRTDLHVVEGELPPLGARMIPGHQIVGEVIAGGDLQPGSRVGVSWLGGTDGSCAYCRRGEENLCDAPVFTGYSVDGGYAEYALARADFTVQLPRRWTISFGGASAVRRHHRLPQPPRRGSRKKASGWDYSGFGASAHLALAGAGRRGTARFS